MDSKGVKRSMKSWTTRFENIRFQCELRLWKFCQYIAMDWTGFLFLGGIASWLDKIIFGLFMFYSSNAVDGVIVRYNHMHFRNKSQNVANIEWEVKCQEFWLHKSLRFKYQTELTIFWLHFASTPSRNKMRTISTAKIKLAAWLLAVQS